VPPRLLIAIVQPSVAVKRKLAIATVAVVLAGATYCLGYVGCSAYWVDGYRVTVHLKPVGDKSVVGVVAKAMYPQEFQQVTEALGSSPLSSPRYFGLLEMDGVRVQPVGDDLPPVPLDVMRHGKDRTFPWRGRIHEFRQEKLALGVSYADGSRDGFIFDIPAPDGPPVISAVLAQDSGVSAVTQCADGSPMPCAPAVPRPMRAAGKTARSVAP